MSAIVSSRGIFRRDRKRQCPTSLRLGSEQGTVQSGWTGAVLAEAAEERADVAGQQARDLVRGEVTAVVEL